MRAMLLTVTLCIGCAISPSPARADMPNYDPEAYCKKISDTIGGSATIYRSCLEEEQTAYNDLKPRWPALTEKIRGYCDRIAKVIGGSFSMLKSCVDEELAATKSNEGFKFQR